METKEVKTVENWAIVYHPDSYTAPEMATPHLNGTWPDGTNKTSTSIQNVKGGLVYTKDSVYKLGDPHPDYEAQFPNAYERIFEALSDES